MQAIELQSITGNAQIALRGVRVRARLAGMSLKATVEQMFVNRENEAIEAVYTFPLPDGAAVCGFEVITGDRVLTGAIEESEHAIEQYDRAIEQGHGAFMVEADRPDVFTARVGNLKPGQSAVVRLTYIAELSRVDKQIRVTFPTTLAPRFASAMGMDPLEAIVEGDALHPPRALWVPYGLSLEVDVDLNRKIKSITSPTHAIRVMQLDEDGQPSSPSPGTPGEGRGEGSSVDPRETDPHPSSLSEYRERGQEGLKRVTLEGATAAMDRDIVLTIDLAKEHEPSADVARGIDGAPYIAVSFVSEFDVDLLAEPAPTETIFVLDCSGSMQGQSIQQALTALELCLRSMNPGDRFNICRFGSTFQMMCSESVVYSQSTLNGALQYISRPADLGGTEIMAPLQAIFAAKPQAAGVRNIVLLTDGQVTNEAAIIDLARKFRHENRIFSFGIGSAASSFLVRGLARATRGAAELISGNERIEDKVLRTFSRIASPMLDDVSIDWGNSDVQTLAEIPPVFDGDVPTVFGRVEGSPPAQVKLNCAVGGKPVSFTVPVRAIGDDGGVISKMWARRTVQSLEEVNNIRRYPRAGDNGRVRQEIIRLSKQFNVLSSVTTFIAIEHRSLEERNDGRPALRRVPVMLAAGWGGGAQIVFGAAAAPMAAKTMDRSIGVLRDSRDRGIGEVHESISPQMRARSSMMSRFLSGFTPKRPAAPSNIDKSLDRSSARVDPVQDLLSLQSADGWFERNDPMILRILPAWKEWRGIIEREMDRLTGQRPADREAVIRTVLVLSILQKRFADREAEWRRAAAKAQRWLAAAMSIDPSALQTWLGAVISAMTPT